jgi:hypothetical protein
MTRAIWPWRPPGPAPGLARSGDIAGRSQETFIDAAGRRRALGSYVFGIHGRFWDQIRDLQFIQDRAGWWRVRLVAVPGADRDQIQRILAQRLAMVGLEFDYVPRIERNANRKRKYFIDATEVAAGDRI